jgi:predicted RNA-binding protein with PUA-like domain
VSKIDRWLIKTEPHKYSLDDLEAESDHSTYWDGVRNYQARNYMRDGMKVGHLCLWYHSNTDPPHAAGVVRVVRTGVADPTQFDPGSAYFDPKSTPDEPRWICMHVNLKERFKRPVPLAELRTYPQLDGMELLRKGSRLSVQPVNREHFNFVVRLGRRTTPL